MSERACFIFTSSQKIYLDICCNHLSEAILTNINKMAKMALYRSPDYKTGFKLIDLSVQEKNFNIGFQDGDHLGFQIRITFVLQVTSVLPMKFHVNWPFGSG